MVSNVRKIVAAASTCNLDLAVCRAENRCFIRHESSCTSRRRISFFVESVPRYFEVSLSTWLNAKKFSPACTALIYGT